MSATHHDANMVSTDGTPELKSETEKELETFATKLPTRWEIELEFVQSLCNIQYLNYLAQNKYLDDPKFVAYLEYLMYWKRPEYARFLVYPNCLHVLTLLQNPEFRTSIVNPTFINTLMNDMVTRWQAGDATISEDPNVQGSSIAACDQTTWDCRCCSFLICARLFAGMLPWYVML